MEIVLGSCQHPPHVGEHPTTAPMTSGPVLGVALSGTCDIRGVQGYRRRQAPPVLSKSKALRPSGGLFTSGTIQPYGRCRGSTQASRRLARGLPRLVELASFTSASLWRSDEMRRPRASWTARGFRVRRGRMDTRRQSCRGWCCQREGPARSSYRCGTFAYSTGVLWPIHTPRRTVCKRRFVQEWPATEHRLA